MKASLRFPRYWTTAVAIALVGCLGPTRGLLPQPSRSLGSLPDPGPGGGLQQASTDPQLGTLTLSVHWPARQSQTLPSSANSLTVQVTNASGANATPLIVLSRGSASTVTTSVQLPAANGYTVAVKAYQDQVPTPSSVVIASGQATVNIQPSTNNAVTVPLTSSFGPSISAFTPNGGPGALITITGGNFSPAFMTITLGVTVGSASVTAFQSLNNNQIVAQVPATASDGNIVVTVNGISIATGSFQVISALNLSPANSTGSVGNPIPFTATASDVLGQAVTSPNVIWSISPSGAISSAGVFTPASTGTYTVQAQSGTVVGTTSVRIQ